jgi:hypothetical protein
MIYTLVIVSLLPPLCFNPYLELFIFILQSKCFSSFDYHVNLVASVFVVIVIAMLFLE